MMVRDRTVSSLLFYAQVVLKMPPKLPYGQKYGYTEKGDRFLCLGEIGEVAIADNIMNFADINRSAILS